MAELRSEHDRALLEHGFFGFTDLVKRPTVRASEVSDEEFAAGVARLEASLKQHAPKIACFLGITGYRRFHRAIAGERSEPQFGPQPTRLGPTRLFLAPSPSGANAHSSRSEQTLCYDRLAAFIGE